MEHLFGVWEEYIKHEMARSVVRNQVWEQYDYVINRIKDTPLYSKEEVINFLNEAIKKHTTERVFIFQTEEILNTVPEKDKSYIWALNNEHQVHISLEAHKTITENENYVFFHNQDLFRWKRSWISRWYSMMKENFWSWSYLPSWKNNSLSSKWYSLIIYSEKKSTPIITNGSGKGIKTVTIE